MKPTSFMFIQGAYIRVFEYQYTNYMQFDKKRNMKTFQTYVKTYISIRNSCNYKINHNENELKSRKQMSENLYW